MPGVMSDRDKDHVQFAMPLLKLRRTTRLRIVERWLSSKKQRGELGTRSRESWKKLNILQSRIRTGAALPVDIIRTGFELEGGIIILDRRRRGTARCLPSMNIRESLEVSREARGFLRQNGWLGLEFCVMFVCKIIESFKWFWSALY